MFEGTVPEDGKTLSGIWTEVGLFTFTLSNDITFFNGTYSDILDPSTATDSWNGARIV